MKAPVWVGLITLLILVSLFKTNAATVFPVATNSSMFEISRGVAFDGSNYLAGMVVGTNVTGQLISSNGALLGSPVMVGSNPGDLLPAIGLAFGQTNYLFVWSDGSVNPGVDMFGQFVSRAGVKVGPQFNLLSSLGSYGFQTVVALASDGTNFLAVWQDNKTGFFYGQLVTPAGTLSGLEFIISSQMQNGGSAAATFGQTNYFVVWQSNNGITGNSNQTFGEFISPNASPGSPFQISQTLSVDQNMVAVAFDGTNYLAVWNRDPPPETGGAVTNWDIYGRLVSQTGAFPGGELKLITDPGSQELPSLAFGGSNYLLSWSDQHWNSDGSFNTTNYNIRLEFLDRLANAAGPEFTFFPSQGTNRPLLALNGLLYDGTRFAMTATLATVTQTNGNITGLASSDVYGGFLSRPPILTAGNYSGSHFSLTLSGTPGFNYAIQMATNLAMANWTTLMTNLATNGVFNFTDTNATNPSRSYRAMAQ